MIRQTPLEAIQTRAVMKKKSQICLTNRPMKIKQMTKTLRGMSKKSSWNKMVRRKKKKKRIQEASQ